MMTTMDGAAHKLLESMTHCTLYVNVFLRTYSQALLVLTNLLSCCVMLLLMMAPNTRSIQGPWIPLQGIDSALEELGMDLEELTDYVTQRII
jgi:hypothetical protein